MATNKSSTMASSSTRPRQLPNAQMVQNFHLVWLDENIDENNNDCRNWMTQLRQVVNTVNVFIDVDECIDFISDIQEEKTIMIASGSFGQRTVPVIHHVPQVNTIYILCENKMRHEQWAKEWPKVHGVYTDVTPICAALKQTAQDCDHNSISISFVKAADEVSKKDLNTLDCSFMYTQILKEILLTIDFEEVHFREFLTYCCEQLAGNTRELQNVHKIEKEYRRHSPIWWYTYQSFLYSMLNRALRLMDVDIIVKMGFFLRDLHNHIAKLHSEQYGESNDSNSLVVYRGQGLSLTDFGEFQKTEGGLLAFNNFLSTSQSRQVSLDFVRRTIATSDLMGVLFVLKIDPSISATPFANINKVSCYQKEEEILFSMHSVFRTGEVKQIEKKNDRLWEVNLTLTGDNDPQLHALTKSMQEEIRGSTGWYRLGRLMIQLGQFNQAKELYDMLLQQTTDKTEKSSIFNNLGRIKEQQGKYEEVITFHEQALEIYHKTLPANHPHLASSYNNIGLVYMNMGEYSKALLAYEQALEIYQKTLPANHPLLATSYHNIGGMHDNMGEYSKALSSYEQALETRQKTLPANHPDLATSYNNIGAVYENMGEHSKALSSFEQALEIFQKTFPANHPHLATSYNNIGAVYENMGEYSKALSAFEQALEIFQKTLPANHPHLATSYNNIGAVYKNKSEYSKALSYYEKDLEIKQKTLRANHPHLATSYSNIGAMYYNMGEYSKALSYYKQALEIEQKALPANHRDLATSYNNIGAMYYNMNEYSKALSFYERALDIWTRSLPPNHPHVKSVKGSIDIVKKKL